jgi:hypothetical protein
MGDLTTCPLREDPCWLWGTVQPKVQRIIDTRASVVLPTVRRSARCGLTVHSVQTDNAFSWC